MQLSMGQIRQQLRKVRKPSALTVTEMLGYPESLKQFLRWIVLTRAVTCEQVAVFLEESEQEAQALISELVAHGLIEHVPTCGVPVYRVCLTPLRLRVPVEILEELKNELPWREGADWSKRRCAMAGYSLSRRVAQ